MQRLSTLLLLLSKAGAFFRSIAQRSWRGVSLLAVFAILTPVVLSSDEDTTVPLRSSETSGADGEETIENAELAWEAQRVEIQTARVEILYWSSLARGSVDWVSASKILDKFVSECTTNADAAKRENIVYECVKSLNGQPIVWEVNDWPQMLIVQDGTEVRNTVSRNGSLISDYAFHDGHTVEFMPGLNGAIMDPGNSNNLSARRGASFIRETPPANLDWQLAASPLGQSTDLSVDFENGPLKIRAAFDLESKILTAMEFSGRTSMRRCQLRPIGGILVPQMGVDVTFRKEHVRSITAFIVRNAEFNEIVEDKELSIDVPKGATVMLRTTESESRSGLARNGGNAVKLATSLPAETLASITPARNTVQGGSSFGMVLVIFTGGALFVAVAYSLFRRKKRT